MPSLNTLASKLNRLDVWRPDVRVGGDRFSGTSFDRLLYLYLNRWGFLGSHERALFERRVRPGMTVCDIGANIGLFTVLLSRLVGATGRVHAFEPEPALFRALSKNCERNGARNTVPHNLAIGEQTGAAVLTRSSVNSGDNRVRSAEPGSGATGETIRIAKLDEVLGDGTVDFIKMDVQGYELRALRGMSRTLASGRPLSMYVEYWPYGLRKAGDDPFEVLALLRDQGFAIHAHHNDEERPVTDLAALAREWDAKITSVNLLAIRG